MDVGMLWFDNDPKADLLTKVRRAASFYQSKYGVPPTMCFVHPTMLPGQRSKAGEIEIRSHPAVLPNHFWIGVNGVQAERRS